MNGSRICFLGFGFDPDNIARLDLPTICTGKTVGATRFHVAEGDYIRTVRSLSPVAINHAGHRDWDSLTFLRETTMIE